MSRGFALPRISLLVTVLGLVAAAADVSTGTAGMFVPVAGRLLDTRDGTGGCATPMPTNTTRSVQALGAAGLATSGVSALALTVVTPWL